VPLLDPALRPAGYKENVHAEVDEPITSWLQTIKLPQVVAPARAAGLVVLDDVVEMEEAEIVSLCLEASLTTAEERRLRRELRVLRRGGAVVAEMFAPPAYHRNASGRQGISGGLRGSRRAFQPYAKPDDIVLLDGSEHRVWVSPFVSATGGEAAVEGEVETVTAVLRRRSRQRRKETAAPTALSSLQPRG
jgi:hypothetical protein